MTAQNHDAERIARLYSALSHVGQAIVRATSRNELFDKVCQALVTHGPFGMAWIGWPDPTTGRILPVAEAGDTDGYTRSIVVCVDERPEGLGPTGRALREDRPYVCNDLSADGAMGPWRTRLERRGLRASAAFPIHFGGSTVGALSVYAASIGFFRTEEIGLLLQAAADLSFALEHMAQAEARQLAEAAMGRYAAIIESTEDGIMSLGLDGIITSWNPGARAMFDYEGHEAIGRPVAMLVPRGLEHETTTIGVHIAAGRHIRQLESVRLRKGDRPFPVSITLSPIYERDADGGARRLVGIAKIVRDISERRANEARVEREQRFVAGLVAAMPGVFYHYDRDGRFLRWNRNFEQVTGYTADEIATMHPVDFFAGAERAAVEARIAEVFAHGEASVEASLVAKDGRATPYFLTGRRIERDGAPELVGVGVDIAERIRAERALAKSEERYRTTLDTTLESCQLIGFDWRYLYLNPAAATQNRRPNAELLGQRMPDVWPGIEATHVYALLRRCMDERVAQHDETEFTFADGSTRWFDVRAQPVPEGIFVLSIDVSERKQAEQALRDLNTNLERLVAERTRDLDAARVRAEAADRIKSAFLATMSHELRTPLNSILGFTGIVLKGMAGPLTPEQSKQLGMVQSSGRHLLDLINDVLDISRIEAGQLELRPAPFDLRAAVERAVASVAPLADKKGLTLEVVVPDGPLELVSDRRRVEQVLLNLLNNAIKFTERGGLRLMVERGTDPLLAGAAPTPVVRLAVADTGIGMRAEDLATLFQPFRQIDSGLQRRHDGTGLGLAICRRLTELLGGRIHVRSEPDVGSVFTFVVPLVRPEAT
ncbi:MAG: PAS domain S-box protein [Polyangiaceae bacterium]|nr:PAS domain S-box protein [Polyangiaceae bacterium]